MDPATAVTAAKVASTVLSVGSTVMGYFGNRNAGIAAQQESEYRAKQLEQRAGQERATAQRQAVIEKRRGVLAQSKVQARAAASGGGALDESVVNIMGDLEGESELNALNSLYEGEERARDDESEAIVTRYSGQQKKKAGYLAARTTALSGFADIAGSPSTQSLLEKYG